MGIIGILETAFYNGVVTTCHDRTAFGTLLRRPPLERSNSLLDTTSSAYF